jgi:hypothetical protein
MNIAKALVGNLTLEILDISSNNIITDSLIEFENLLKNNCGLIKLVAHSNNISLNAVKGISKALKDNCNLQYLDLSNNELEDDAAMSLLDVLKKYNYFIKVVKIDENPGVFKETEIKIQKEMEHNHLIERFIIKGDSSKHRVKVHIDSLLLSFKEFENAGFISKFAQFHPELVRLDLSHTIFSSSI